MRQVQTRRGPRTVQNFPATPEFWRWWQTEEHPPWVSLQKNDLTGAWWVTVWGLNAEEVRRNVRDVNRAIRRATIDLEV